MISGRKGWRRRFGLAWETLESAAKDAEGVLLMTCDQPAVTAEHLRSLMSRAEVKASRYAGRSGVPAFFPKRVFRSLMELQGDAGARELLAEARYEELENGELDVDTAEDLGAGAGDYSVSVAEFTRIH